MSLHSLFLLASLLVPQGEPSLAVKPGQPAPDFRVRSLDGRTLTLRGLRGKTVLLDFWAVDCPPCRIEMPHLQALADKYRARGLVVVGIAEMNPKPAEARKALAARHARYSAAIDTGEVVGKRYGVTAHPATVIIDRSGTVRRTDLGFVEGDEKELERAIVPLLRPAKAVRR